MDWSKSKEYSYFNFYPSECFLSITIINEFREAVLQGDHFECKIGS